MSSPLDRLEAQIRNYIPVRPDGHPDNCLDGNCGAHSYLTALVNVAKAAEHILAHGKLGKQSERRLREALAALNKGQS